MPVRLRRLTMLAPSLVPLLAAMALGACHDREPEQQPFDNDANVVENIAPENIMPAPEPDNAQNAAKPAPPPEISDEQQMLDDAAAVGMTARLPNGENGGQHPDAPVERKGGDAASGNSQELGQIY
ncbi:hypothetical protein [Sphingobium aquiterrae]|uniref:hypothetical protein n=1 Tax=Sphingobium aquiterrae TaxID=2038656 RepID=UPI0030183D8B